MKNYKITAIITLYYPDLNVRENIINISKQVDRIFLCDNSQFNNSTLFDRIDNVEYISNIKNFGTSKAFNLILKENFFEEHEMVIFFDQDSDIKEGHIKKLVSEYNRLKKKGIKVGCIGPYVYNQSRKEIELPRYKNSVSPNSYLVHTVIASSMLCEFQIIKSVNYWNEKIFLDLADWDFCWRINSIGYECVLSNVSVLQHKVGEGDRSIGKIKIRNSSPFRSYYQIRDGLVLFHEKYIPLKYRFRYIGDVIYKHLMSILFLEDKAKRMKYFVWGIKDYLRNIEGALVCK